MLPSSVDGSVFRIRDKNEALEEKYGIRSRPVILSLARLSAHEHKGQDRVLKAFVHVLERLPDAVCLVVGGGQDHRIDEVLSEHPQIRKNVIFTGTIANEERLDYYNLADVYVLPSKYEGFGIVFIEALACGIPVVASDGYGCREGLLDGQLGVLVDPDDPESIAKALLDILDRPEGNKLFDREQLRQKTLDIYGLDNWDARVRHLVNRESPLNNTTFSGK